ncbi:hypothetical protein PV328_011542 [Microctonus aethiopoides]|uniref:non-specific serine/threonine protein kinase n=1 Tax=Microctonus aethiopoides TaxID=144406 RepID=A0AA39C4Q9_9HYME|nr:hypothetical protein PV328_011542 [Microctonus aethiopoides]
MAYGRRGSTFEDREFDYRDNQSNMSYAGDNYHAPRHSNRDSSRMMTNYRSDRNESNFRDSGGGGGGSETNTTLRRLDSIQDPGKRYVFQEEIGSGVCGTVFSAIDNQAGNKKVALKIQNLTADTQSLIVEEYRVFRDCSGHPNIPDFYGIYRKRSGKKNEPDQIWFVMELCDGGSVMDLVRSLAASQKKMREEHIAYILKEIIKAVVYLHENNIIHRDIRGHNILLTKEGEVKLIDFGLARGIKGEMGKRRTSIGSPCWMAPEIIASRSDPKGGYGMRADVWSLGITAIELADGKAPYQDIHPTRTLFQIVRNPPPTFYRPDNWSANFIDFITECLEKNPENRPVMAELMEHPFISELAQEVKVLVMNLKDKPLQPRPQESLVRNGYLKADKIEFSEVMLTEDLAALESLTEDTILDELHERLRQGDFHSFVGDVLLILNPNEIQDIYGPRYHEKYNFKSRSDNAPHIYSVADKAYQDVLHNEETQNILFAGESKSGKTTNLFHSSTDIGLRIIKAINLIHAFSHASTPLNSNSTRCVLQIQTTFGSTGKASGAIFWLYQLEKWRVSTPERTQSNFHIFYYLYDAFEAKGMLRKYKLPSGRRLRYLRMADPSTKTSEYRYSTRVRDDPQGNCLKFDEINEALKLLEMDDYMETIWRTLSAILILGEVKFIEESNGEADVGNIEVATIVAEHLGLESKKFIWALTNYCVIKKGAAVRRKHTCEEAKMARDVLASTLYHRLVDCIVNYVNMKLSITRTLFGDKYLINILDLFGFECFAVNRLEQLIVNTMNEQLQCYYNQRIFAWEMQEQEEEEIPLQHFHYYNNREAIEQLMGRDYGLFEILDRASRQLQDAQYILEKVKEKSKGMHIKAINYHEFTVAHYTGKVVYNAGDIVEKNRDFVSPEIINTMRLSQSEMIKEMFTNQLTKSGNLTIIVNDQKEVPKKQMKNTRGFVIQEPAKLRKYNSSSRGQYSQSRKMRTCSSVFRSTSLELLKNLSISSGHGGTHFIRCIRADLKGHPREFYREVVRQQIRALGLLDTAKARQRGYPHRIPFQEFLRRYKFLAFDFEENVEMTKDNCRLLLIRLKIEGWIIGKTKVFLKYYNEEYLSRLYEIQVRKIVKIQCMMRSFLARKKLNRVAQKKKEISKKKSIQRQESNLTADEAALKIQKTYRGHAVRKEVRPLLSTEFDDNTKQFMMFYSAKWRSKSIFQVLLQYRAARYQDLVQLSQQVHLYNQVLSTKLQATNQHVTLDKINPNINIDTFLSEPPMQVHKIPFNMREEFPYFDTSYMNDPGKARKRTTSTGSSATDDEHEPWDAPLQKKTVPWATTNTTKKDAEVQTTNSPHHAPRSHHMNSGQDIINTPFTRDPNVPIQMPPMQELPIKQNFTTGFQSNQYNHQKFNNRINSSATNASIPHPNNYNNGSLRYKKKTPPPPIPNHMQSDWNESRNHSKNVDNYSSEDRTNRNIPPTTRANPINELKSIGRRGSNNNVYADEPPFNFQAMLRKTHHHRDSMKRTQVYESYTPSSLPPPPPFCPPSPPPFSNSNNLMSLKSYKADNDPDSVTIYHSNSRIDSPEWNPNEMVIMSEKYGRNEAWEEDGAAAATSSKYVEQNGAGGNFGGNSNDKFNFEPKTTILGPDGLQRIELAPGVIIEGYCADL